MISYREWKLRSDIKTEDHNIDQQVNDLVNVAVGEIEKAIGDYLGKIPTASVAPEDSVSKFGGGIRQSISNYLNQPVSGELTPGEKLSYGLGGKVPTRGDRLSSWWKKFKGKWGDRVGQFFMKKEWDEFSGFLENCVTEKSLQLLFLECGVSRYVIVENDFSFLQQSIRSTLMNLGEKIKSMFHREPETPVKVAPVPSKPIETPKPIEHPVERRRAAREAPRVVGKPAPSKKPSKEVPVEIASKGKPSKEIASKGKEVPAESVVEQDYIRQALNSRGNVESFAKLVGKSKRMAFDNLVQEIMSKSAEKGITVGDDFIKTLKTNFRTGRLWKGNSSIMKTLRNILEAKPKKSKKK